MTDLIFYLLVLGASVLSYGLMLGYWQNAYPDVRDPKMDFIASVVCAIPFAGWMVASIFLVARGRLYGIKFIPEGPVDRWEGVWDD